VLVTSPTGCTWSASSGARWLPVTTAAAGGNGNGETSFTVQANTAGDHEERDGHGQR
jgi:hypothetical protein